MWNTFNSTDHANWGSSCFNMSIILLHFYDVKMPNIWSDFRLETVKMRIIEVREMVFTYSYQILQINLINVLLYKQITRQVRWFKELYLYERFWLKSSWTFVIIWPWICLLQSFDTYIVYGECARNYLAFQTVYIYDELKKYKYKYCQISVT